MAAAAARPSGAGCHPVIFLLCRVVADGRYLSAGVLPAAAFSGAGGKNVVSKNKLLFHDVIINCAVGHGALTASCNLPQRYSRMPVRAR